MRILLFTRIFELARGGAENYAFRLFQALADRGHELHVVTDRGETVPGIAVYLGLDRMEAVTKQVRPELTVDWGFFRSADIHRLGGGAHRSFLRYSLNAYPPSIRWYKWLRNRSPRNRALIRKQEEMLRQRGSFFAANSRFCADQLVEAGADPDFVRVLHNGVDTGHFRPGPKDDPKIGKLRASWGVGPAEAAMLFVAHNLLLKNFSLMRRVFDRLVEEQKVRLIVVGKRRPGRVPPNVVYAGELSDMAACYRAADCLVHPTHFDSCANVVLEAMSSGLPVLASDVCGANELISDGENGFVLPVTGDVDTVRRWERLVRIVGSDGKLRRRMGAAARAAMEKNDFKGYVDRFEALMKEVRLLKER